MIARRLMSVVLLSVFSVVSVLAALPAQANSALVSSSEEGIAIGGYDPVSFHDDTGPLKGRIQHALMWKGAVWLFASSANQVRFEANPRHYEPRFGGYCALALAYGQLAVGDPQSWVIRDGNLYLFKNDAAERSWNDRPDAHLTTAERAWPQVLRD